MIDDALLMQLKELGMSEYEAKVYVILTALRVATAREIHEQTKIPRGRIYETLALLGEKGFILSSGKTPVRYSPVDVTQTFERLKKDSISSLDELYRRLKALETETPAPQMQGYKLCTEWTRDSQIRMILNRAKTEILFLCNDGEYLARYKNDIARVAKEVPFYLVIGNEDLAGSAPVKCYTGGNDIDAALLCPGVAENTGLKIKLLLIADRHESLSILEENGQTTGIFICPDIFAAYLSRKMVQEIQPVNRSHTRA